MKRRRVEREELRVVLDRLAKQQLVAWQGVDQQVDPTGSTYRLSARPGGVEVCLGHAHEAHLWLETADGWRSDAVDSNLEDLLSEWLQMLDLGKRIAWGKEVPHAKVNSRTWVSTDGYVLNRAT